MMRSASIFTFLALALVSTSVAQESCVLTETSCQCSPSTTSGLCLRSQGDGTCLLGKCAEGYKCDCFGFEMCSQMTCAQHVPAGGIPSETVPFQCIVESAAGTCIDFVGFVDTFEGARNAESDASTSHDEATAIEEEGVRYLEEILAEKKAVNHVMKDVESEANQIPPAELDEIEKEARVVLEAVSGAGTIVMSSVEDAAVVADLTLKTRKAKRACEKYHVEATEKAKDLEQESEKMYRDEAKIDQLRKEIEELNFKRSEYGKLAGKMAKEARDRKKVCDKKLKAAGEVKEKAVVAAEQFMDKCKKSLNRTNSESRQKQSSPKESKEKEGKEKEYKEKKLKEKEDKEKEYNEKKLKEKEDKEKAYKEKEEKEKEYKEKKEKEKEEKEREKEEKKLKEKEEKLKEKEEKEKKYNEKKKYSMMFGGESFEVA